jgi:hypothetical protein
MQMAPQFFFIRGVIEIPVTGRDEPFGWTVWVSVSGDNFARAVDAWYRPGRESEPPYFGWLSNEISVYPDPTINLKAYLRTRPVGQRPWIELEPTGHPLAVEQRNGIDEARVREIAARAMH